MCVVLGVGVISVFDAVAFLACAHRVSSTHDRMPGTIHSQEQISAINSGGRLVSFDMSDLFGMGHSLCWRVPHLSMRTRLIHVGISCGLTVGRYFLDSKWPSIMQGWMIVSVS